MEFLKEQEVIERLLKLGYSKKHIDKYRKTKCVGCCNPRNMCQCPFGGSAHPTPEERFERVRHELNEQ